MLVLLHGSLTARFAHYPPHTTTHHHSDTPPSTIHHHTPLHHHLRPTTQTHTPLYTSLLQDGLHGDVGEACRTSMLDELEYDLVRSVGKKGKTILIAVKTIDAYVNNSAEDRTWVQGTPKKFAPYTSVHHRTPSHTCTGNHWFHAVATMFKCCIVLAVHGHHYVHVFGDQTLRTIHLYKKDGLTHYDALLPESPDDADDDAVQSGESTCARFPPPLLRCTLTRKQMKTTLNTLAIQSCCHTPQR